MIPVVGAQTPDEPGDLVRTEVQSERNAHTKVYEELDGSKTAVTYTQPIHFQGDNGSWKEIDNRLVPQPDGTGFENAAGGVAFDFAPAGAAAELVEVTGEAGGFGFGLESASGTEPVVDGSTITYPSVYPGVDLRFQVVGETLKELVVLQAPPQVRGPRLDFRFPLAKHGLSARATSDGRIVMEKADGTAVFTLPKPFMYDSAADDGSGEAAFSEDIHFALEQSGAKQFMRVTADASWLTDPARVYPVFIDPTVGPKTPTVDTFVQSNILNTPQDTLNELRSGYYSGPDGTFTARSLMKFDLAAIPTGANITSATLSVHENHSYSCNARVVEVYRVADNWGSGVTWTNRPGLAASPADTINAAKGYSTGCPAGRLAFNVQSIVSYWKNSSATNEGFALRAQSETDTFGWKKFASDQTVNKPELTVNYTDPNSPPWEPVHEYPTGGAVTGAFPNLKATYRDPDAGDWGTVEFEIYQSGTCCGNPHRWGTGSGGNPGTSSSWQPNTSLSDGNYTWRARGNDGVATSGWTATTSFSVDTIGPGTPNVYSGPVDPSRTTNPYFYFSGAESGGSFTCRLTKDGFGFAGPSGCSSPASYWTNGDGRYAFFVKQLDAQGNASNEGTWSYTLDTTAPAAPNIYSHPTSPSQNRQPTWYFSGEPNATFSCRLVDSGSETMQPCSSPVTYDLTGRADKTYSFEVKQTDRAGNTSNTAFGSYTLDTTPAGPPSIDSGPSGSSNNPAPMWTFSGESLATFECQLTGPVSFAIEGCATSKTYNLSGSPDGIYTFWVRQTDRAGNKSVWQTRSFTLDRQPPGAPTITSSPSSPSNSRLPQWGFVGDAGAPLQCRLLMNGLTVFDYAACSSPKTFDLAGKADGKYVFQVRQVDAAGNPSLPASSPEYELDTTNPAAPTITGSPTSPSSSRSPAWSFTGEAGATFTCALRDQNGYISERAPCTSPRQYDLTGRPDGTYFFEVYQKDRAGNLGMLATATYVLDTAAAGQPVITARPNDFTANPQPQWSFTGETGAAFECELRSGATVVFAFAVCGSGKSYDLTAKSDGAYEFAVRQKDAAGNVSLETTDGFTLDRAAPGKPLGLFSPTHLPKVGFKARVIEMTWSKPAETDLSGIAGYCFVFSADVNGAASETSSTTFLPGDPTKCSTDTATSSAELNQGTYWFSVRAIDKAGNFGPEETYGPMIVDPQGSPIPLAPTLSDVLVAQSDTNGMEQFYPYRTFDLGTYTGYVNLDSGNLVAQGTDVSIPGKGLNTVIRHTYNSHRNDDSHHDTGMGRGWTLSLSDVDGGLDAVGAILEIDLNAPVVPTSGDVVGAVAPVLGGILELTDGDGTVHRFIRPGAPGTRWESPPGVSLRVRENLDPTTGMPASYDLIRPDGVVYHVEPVAGLNGLTQTWHVSSITDRHGNAMTLGYTEYQDIPAASLSKVRVTSVSHNRAASNPVVTLDYVSGRLQKIASLPGTPDNRELTYGYTEDRLTTVTENAELAAAKRRVTTFGYELYEGSAGDPLAADVKLLARVDDAVIDPGDAHGNRTRLIHDDGAATGENRLTDICDRNDFEDGSCDKPWKIVYGDPDPNSGEQTTRLETPLGSSTSYLISDRSPVSEGDPRISGANILKITDAGSPTPVVNHFRWVENRLVEKTNAVGNDTLMEYNDLGLLTKIEAPAPNRGDAPAGALKERITTSFVYDPVVADGSRRYSYEDDKCTRPEPGAGPVSKAFYCDAVAEMVRSTSAAGRPDKRVIDFVHSPGTGDVSKVIQRVSGDTPLPYVSSTRTHIVGPREDGDRQITMIYNSFGGVTEVDGPRLQASDIATFSDFHTTGMPRTITDARNNDKTFTFSPYGAVTTNRDRGGRLTTMTYDHRDNLVSTVGPDGDEASFSYDMNDNIVSATSPKGSASPAEGDFTNTTGYDANEWPVSSNGPGATEAERVTTRAIYNPDGTKKFEDGPPAIGARTAYEYFANQQLRSVTTDAGQGQTATVNYEYDAAGRKARVTMPSVNGSSRPTKTFSYTPTGAAATVNETSATGTSRVTRFVYDAFGAQVRVLGPRSRAGHQQEQTQAYDVFGQSTVMKRLLDVPSGTRWLTYSTSYDLAGNQTATTQPTGTGGDSLTATFDYDALNRVTRQTDPQNPGHETHFSYLPEGQQEFRRDYNDANRDGSVTDGELQRTVKAVYNSDYSVAEMIATDWTKQGSPTVAACNYPAGDLGGGYDRNGNLLVARTVVGTGGCEGGDVVRTERFAYDARDSVDDLTQQVQAPGLGKVTRTQDFTYRADGQLTSSSWDSDKTTSYSYSKGGLLLSATDWRAGTAASTFNYFPSGALSSESLGGGVATATFGYHPDGAIESLTWNRQGAAAPVRKHSAISYDIGGLRTAEDVLIEQPATNAGGDTGGHASFEHDLAGRLVSWTSPFELSDDVTGTDQPVSTYTLDDGGNITREEVRAGGSLRKENVATFVNSRLESRSAKTYGLVAGGTDTTTATEFTYSALGEETRRSMSTSGTGVPVPQTQAADSSYDPAGRTKKADNTGNGTPADVDYLYDATGQLIARTAGGKTTYLFYFASGSTLAEETRPSGTTKTRYFNSSSGQILAEQRFADGVDGEPDQTGPTWVWLLRDPAGSIATEIRELPAGGAIVAAQRAYDPYGAADAGGTTAVRDEVSGLGYKGDRTDEDTGNILLGPRIYDPTTDRFTTADFFVASGSDLALGTDPLTGNRYVFAAANPVAFYENGYGVDRGIGVEPHGWEGSSGGGESRTDRAVGLTTSKRLASLSRFFAAYPGTYSSDPAKGGFGRAILDFTRWEAGSGRLGTGGSEWWKAINGSMVLDINQAYRLLKQGGSSSGAAGVQAWIDYAQASTTPGASAQQAALWHAHQTSLHTAVDSTRTLFAVEAYKSLGEGQFMDTVVKNVDGSAIENWSSDSADIAMALDSFYPSSYPVEIPEAFAFGLASSIITNHPNTGIMSTRKW